MKTERWIRENLEAVAIAIVMALVIRQFAVEAFMIPTGSMTPTLFGKENGKRPGDRILVDKIGPMVGGLSRWDVIVFRYPLNESRNYIKRLIGLGGETVTIHDGDIYADGSIARKPEDVQRVLSYRVYPVDLPPGAPPDDDWLASGTVEREGADFLARGAGGEAVLVYRRDVRDARPWVSPPTGGRHVVGDRELRLEVTPASAGGHVFLRLSENGRTNVLHLAVGSGESWLGRGDQRIPLEGVLLLPGETTEVRLSNYDCALRARVGRRRFLYEHAPDARVDHSSDQLAFGARGVDARFADVEVRRDIYYVAEENCRDVEIPEGHLYVLGDNSLSSRDSRRWRKRIFEMNDGTVYERDTQYDPDSDPPFAEEPGQVVFQDIRGIWRRIEAADIRREWTEQASLVPRDNVVGRAFFVFWPLDPRYADRVRVGFIR